MKSGNFGSYIKTRHMKNILAPLLLLAILFSSCGQNKAKQHQDAINDMMEQYGNKETKNSNAASPAAKPVSAADASSGLMGKWESTVVTGDNNSNGILDPEELSKAISYPYEYLELRPDGTCLYSQSMIKCRYEIVEKNGNKSIEIIVPDGTRMKPGRIISLKPGELQLMKFTGGRDIIVYKRG